MKNSTKVMFFLSFLLTTFDVKPSMCDICHLEIKKAFKTHKFTKNCIIHQKCYKTVKQFLEPLYSYMTKKIKNAKKTVSKKTNININRIFAKTIQSVAQEISEDKSFTIYNVSKNINHMKKNPYSYLENNIAEIAKSCNTTEELDKATDEHFNKMKKLFNKIKKLFKTRGRYFFLEALKKEIFKNPYQ